MNPAEIPPLQTATEIRDFLAQVMTDLRKRVIDSKTASVLASLATAQLRAVSAATLEERVSNLERKVGENAPPETTPGLMPADQWEKLFASDEYIAPSASEPAPDDDTEGERSAVRPRSMPEGWTVPEASSEDASDDWSVPLHRR
jgi:hypothetical protein